MRRPFGLHIWWCWRSFFASMVAATIAWSFFTLFVVTNDSSVVTASREYDSQQKKQQEHQQAMVVTCIMCSVRAANVLPYFFGDVETNLGNQEWLRREREREEEREKEEILWPSSFLLNHRFKSFSPWFLVVVPFTSPFLFNALKELCEMDEATVLEAQRCRMFCSYPKTYWSHN